MFVRRINTQSHHAFVRALAIFVAAMLLALAGCSTEDKSDSGGDKGGESGKTKAAALKPAKVASMGIEIDATEGASVTDNTETAMFPSATIYASPTIFLTGKNDMFWKKDAAAQKAEIEKDVANKFKKWTKEDVTDTGFHYEFESTSMMDEPLYGFHIRTTINGKEFDCSSNTSSPEELAHGVKMCKTLRAAK